MKLSEILKGSEYNLTQFSEAIINEFENRITEKIFGNKSTNFTICLVRKKVMQSTKTCQTATSDT